MPRCYITFHSDLSHYRLPESGTFSFVPRIGEKVECLHKCVSVTLTVIDVIYTHEGDVRIKLG